MNSTIKTILFLVIVIHLFFIIDDIRKRKEMTNYFKDIGFDYYKKMSSSEIQASYVYLHDLKGDATLASESKSLYDKLKSINNKFNNIFSKIS